MSMELDRRTLLGALASAGIVPTAASATVSSQDQATPRTVVTPEMVHHFEAVVGITFTDAQRRSIAAMLTSGCREFTALRGVKLPNSVPPALHFQPLGSAGVANDAGNQRVSLDYAHAPTIKSRTDLALMTVADQARLLRKRQVSSVELTKLYLTRLKQFDPILKCVVTLTEEVALRQAAQADRELAAGQDRGPLHGIPWGAKDLMAYPGYPTTWGAGPYKQQRIETKATVAERLERAGAVLVAKLTLGALAMGDQWFGGMTRNPWNPAQGSSGSSAGSAAAASAGLVSFAIGTETLGSIVSPCRRCLVSGLRPTFGRVSRHGCMALCWSMDKVGPIARSLEDCALVFAAIHGHDPQDAATVTRPFSWPTQRPLGTFRVGYFPDHNPDAEREDLKVLKDLGVNLVPLTFKPKVPVEALRIILDVEAATAFDELTRQGVTEGIGTWPQTFRKGQFIPAVEYLRANRIRTLLMQEQEEFMAHVDAYVGGNDLMVTNLTGHPTIVLPNGFREVNGRQVPRTLTFTGKLYGEADLLALGHAYQQATGFHLKHPPLARLGPAWW